MKAVHCGVSSIRTGKLVIRPQFDTPLWFSEGLVEGYGKENGILNVPLGSVDKSDRYVIGLDEQGMRIEFLVGFSEGLARVSMQPEHPTAAWDRAIGVTLTTPESGLSHGRLLEQVISMRDWQRRPKRGGSWGYIDTTGQFVIAPRFEAAMEFSEGLAAVRVTGKWGFIDRTGTVVIAPQFEGVSGFRGGMARIASGRKVG